MTKEKEFTIVIDSREQTPYEFKDKPSIVKGLKTGDYSILGYEDRFAIERKSYQDFVGSIGSGRERFEREIQRGAEMERFAVVLEFDLKNVWSKYISSKRYIKTKDGKSPKTHPNSIINTALMWTLKYNIPIFFCSTRANGRNTIVTLCRAWMKYFAKDETETLKN